MKKPKLPRSLTFFLVFAIAVSTALAGCGDADKKAAPEGGPSQGILERVTGDGPGAENVSEEKPFEGYRAPDFELEDLSGNKVKLSSLCGKTVVVNFWSLDCPYCLAEMPEFEAFYSSKPEEVEVLMVNLDRDQRKLATYIKNKGYTFTVLKDEKARTLRDYLIRGVPTTIVIGNDGIVKARVEGPVTKKDLESLTESQSSGKPQVHS
jgi:thiol-disulfide isomerase/thioredoxin